MTINEDNWDFLHQATGLSKPFNQMYFKYLRSLGYKDTLQQMIAKSGLGLNPGSDKNPGAGGGYPPPLPNVAVFIGSSMPAGYGCSTYIGGTGTDPFGPVWASHPTSVMGLIDAGLKSIDPSWVTFNRSISGTSTKDSMDRFFTDVAVHRPSVVVLANHARNSNYNWAEEREELSRARSYCNLIGAKLYVRGFDNDEISDPGIYTYGLAHDRWIDENGFARIDFRSTLDDGTGNYISPGTYDVDGLHRNDAGYAIAYSAVDLGVFTAGNGQAPETDFADGAWRVPVSTSYDAILVAGVGKALKSFTVHARIKGVASGGNTGKAFIDVAGASASVLRLINPSAALVWREASTDRAATAITPSADANPHDFTLTYNRPTNTLVAYVDGISIGSASLASPADITAIVYGSRAGASNAAFPADGYSFTDLAAWNVPLSASEVARIAASDGFQAGSMIFRGKMDEVPFYPGSIPNAVHNGTSPSLGLAWEAVTPF